jgi:hypothetical protein
VKVRESKVTASAKRWVELEEELPYDRDAEEEEEEEEYW